MEPSSKSNQNNAQAKPQPQPQKQKQKPATSHSQKQALKRNQKTYSRCSKERSASMPEANSNGMILAKEEENDAEVRREDQDKINEFGQLNARLHEVKAESKNLKVSC